MTKRTPLARILASDMGGPGLLRMVLLLGGVAAMHGRRRVRRKLRRRPEIPLNPPRGLVDEALPACLLTDRCGHRVQKRRPLRGRDRRGQREQQVHFFRCKCERHSSGGSGWGCAR